METKEVVIEKIYVNSQDQAGSAYRSKKGRLYTMVKIEYDGGQKASMYCDSEWNARKIDRAKEVKVGDKLTLMFERNGEYMNFDFPQKADILEVRVKAVEEKLEAVKQMIVDLDAPKVKKVK